MPPPGAPFLGEPPLPGDGVATPCRTWVKRGQHFRTYTHTRRRVWEYPEGVVLLELFELFERGLVDAHGEVVAALHKHGHLDHQVDRQRHQRRIAQTRQLE